MATQMQLARQGVITEAMKIVAEQEHVTAEFIREGVANGTIAIPCNINHKNIIPRGEDQKIMQLADVHRFLLNLRVVWVKNTAFWPDCKAAGSKIPLFPRY